MHRSSDQESTPPSCTTRRITSTIQNGELFSWTPPANTRCTPPTSPAPCPPTASSLRGSAKFTKSFWARRKPPWPRSSREITPATKTRPTRLHDAAYNYINTHGKDLHGEPLGKYFIHGLGHYVGLNVHDVGDYRSRSARAWYSPSSRASIFPKKNSASASKTCTTWTKMAS